MQGLTKPEAFVFDWDGTLVESLSLVKRCLAQTMAYMERPDLMPDPLVPISTRDFFASCFGGEAARADAYYYGLIEAHHLDHLEPLEGAQDLLDFLRARKLPLFILSNKRGDLLRREVAHLGWEMLFQKVVGSGDAVRDKPSVVALDLTLAGTPWVPSADIWFIGDTWVDMACAHQSGCTGVLLGKDSSLNSSEWEFSPKILVNKCEDLKNLLVGVL